MAAGVTSSALNNLLCLYVVSSFFQNQTVPSLDHTFQEGTEGLGFGSSGHGWLNNKFWWLSKQSGTRSAAFFSVHNQSARRARVWQERERERISNLGWQTRRMCYPILSLTWNWNSWPFIYYDDNQIYSFSSRQMDDNPFFPSLETLNTASQGCHVVVPHPTEPRQAGSVCFSTHRSIITSDFYRDDAWLLVITWQTNNKRCFNTFNKGVDLVPYSCGLLALSIVWGWICRHTWAWIKTCLSLDQSASSWVLKLVQSIQTAYPLERWPLQQRLYFFVHWSRHISALSLPRHFNVTWQHHRWQPW